MKPVGHMFKNENSFGKQPQVRKGAIMGSIIYQPIYDRLLFSQDLRDIHITKLVESTAKLFRISGPHGISKT